MMATTEITDRRLQLLVDQLDSAWEMLDARLTGRKPFSGDPGGGETDLTDEEYFWEPMPGCWSLRRRTQATTNMATGKGDWVMERERPEPKPPPVTTIAWRMCHLVEAQMMRYDWTFGSHSFTWDSFDWPSHARDAVAMLRDSHTRWRTALTGMTSEELDQVGRSQMPHGLDPQVPFDALLAWTNTEYTHHAAEVGCLRDLYRAQFGR
jgi:hypothetical protein